MAGNGSDGMHFRRLEGLVGWVHLYEIPVLVSLGGRDLWVLRR